MGLGLEVAAGPQPAAVAAPLHACPDEGRGERGRPPEGHGVAAPPRSADVSGIVPQKFLVLAPLRHPLCVIRALQPAALALLPGPGGLGLLLVLLHFRLRGEGTLAELRRRLQGGLPGLVRERALARERVVEPLREEPAVHGDLPAVGAGDALQLLLERPVEPHGLVLVAGHVPQYAQDVLGLRDGRAHRRLDLAEDRLTLVHAADQVVRPGHDAVRRPLQVVGDDQLLPKPLRRLVQGAELPQVGLGLAEAPLAVEVGPVEVGEAHAAGPPPVHLHQTALYRLALRLPEGGEGAPDARDNPVGVAEGVPARHRDPGAALRSPVQPRELHALDRPVDHARDLAPVRQRLVAEVRLIHEELDALLVFTHHPVDHVVLQDIVEPSGVECLVRLQVVLRVHELEEGGLRVEHQLLEGLHHDERVLEREPVHLGVAVEHHLHQPRDLLAEDLRGAVVGRVELADRLETADHDARCLHEVAVGDVAELPPLHPVVPGLGQRAPDGLDDPRDHGGAVAAPGGAAPTAQHRAHGGLELVAARLGVDGGVLRAPPAQEALAARHGVPGEEREGPCK
mmetsp:Transcript_25285/g.71311  ORF Transcript_25285/g.71311 Transcript_25285/m.71311 type:complete len:568 (-) Transcript_25285:64-1767(-)